MSVSRRIYHFRRGLQSRFGQFSRPQSTNVIVPRDKLKSKYDVIVIGAGHNGLIASAYLAMSGQSVCVLERRHVIGGAAVTEELIPGFKFSRASYVLSLLRPQIYKDLELKRHGLRVHVRDPGSYTPLRQPTPAGARSLLLGLDPVKNSASIAQFSRRDAENFAVYNRVLERIAEGIEPLLDTAPVDLHELQEGGWRAFREQIPAMKALLRAGRKIGSEMSNFVDLMTAPAEKFLGRWLESEPLKATLATDAVIGAHQSPRTPGSGYTLLHHVMGGLEDLPGAWGYVEGGMGALSNCIAAAARAQGVDIFTEQEVAEMKVGDGGVSGVVLRDGTEVEAPVVLSNATAEVTFSSLLPTREKLLSETLRKQLDSFSYQSPVTKINVAVSRIPTFVADPAPGVQPWHHGTIHLNSESCEDVHEAFLDADRGQYSKSPIIEMTIPSSLDKTVAPPGAHVVQLFTQYTPFELADGMTWDDATRNAYAQSVFDSIEDYCPGFKSSIVGADILTPPDLQRIFGLTGGNIFHGAVSLDQIYFLRPASFMSNYRSPISGLYLCGSSAHPGGGVMGAAGRLAAFCALRDMKRKSKRRSR